MRSKVRQLIRTVAIFLLAGSLGACQEDFSIVHRSCAVESKGWENGVKPAFLVTDLAREGKYALSVEARLGRDYPYKDLWLAVETRMNGEVLADDTVCLTVVNDRGEMPGTGRNLLEYAKGVRTLEATPMDTLDFCIRHVMSEKSIPGVHDVGIKLVPEN